jgi:hypothetical protein
MPVLLLLPAGRIETPAVGDKPPTQDSVPYIPQESTSRVHKATRVPVKHPVRSATLRSTFRRGLRLGPRTRFCRKPLWPREGDSLRGPASSRSTSGRPRATLFETESAGYPKTPEIWTRNAKTPRLLPRGSLLTGATLEVRCRSSGSPGATLFGKRGRRSLFGPGGRAEGWLLTASCKGPSCQVSAMSERR